MGAVTIIDSIEAELLNGPQVECEVEHFFHDGVYIRQVKMPAGALVIGHHHKYSSLNVMVSGKMIVPSAEGPIEISAPVTFVSPPGRKIALIVDDVVWQNVYATSETDPEVIEAAVVNKSDAFLNDREARDVNMLKNWSL